MRILKSVATLLIVGAVVDAPLMASHDNGEQTERANSARKELRRATFWEIGRPESFYELTYVRPGEAKVCDMVLDGLNDPWPWPSDIESTTAVQAWADVLTATKYNVEWEELAGPELPTSRAVVDIDNNGELDTVYRRSAHDRTATEQYLIATTESPGENESLTGEKSREEWDAVRQYFDEIRGPLIRLRKNDSFHLGEVTLKSFSVDYGAYPIPDAAQGLGQIKNVLILDNETLVLAGGSFEQSLSGHPLPLRLYRPHSYHGHKFICEFQTQYQY